MKTRVTIEKIISDGKGLARPEKSKVVMVPGVLPGEEVEITPVREYKGYISAQLDTIVHPSPLRTDPFCPWYRKCGGCDLQHAVYDYQLTVKQGILQEALDRAGVDCSEAQVLAPLASPQHKGYRHRIRLQLDQKGQIGFHKTRTHALVPINTCPVAAPKINTAITWLQQEQPLQPFADHCREIEMFVSPADGTLSLLLNTGTKKKIHFSFLKKLTETPFIFQAGYKIKGRIVADNSLAPLSQNFSLPQIRENSDKTSHPLQYTLSWAASCFSQVNNQQNAQLVALVCTLAGTVQNKSVLDLYCGAGNFSIPLALMGAAVTGIELNRESIRWAKENAQQVGVTARFFATDVANSLQQLCENNEHADILLLDPPRRGLGRSAQHVAKIADQKIIYISCDPATLARDLATICKQGFHLTHLAPVDMFPQTHHIETVAVLEKNSIAK